MEGEYCYIKIDDVLADVAPKENLWRIRQVLGKLSQEDKDALWAAYKNLLRLGLEHEIPQEDAVGACYNLILAMGRYKEKQKYDGDKW